jgi:hypothetical protein
MADVDVVRALDGLHRVAPHLVGGDRQLCCDLAVAPHVGEERDDLKDVVL